MAKINPSKLLPSAKNSSAIVVRPKTTPVIKEKKTNISSAIKPIELRSSALSKDVVRDQKVEGVDDINNKLVKIEKFFESDLILSRKKSEEKRKDEEKQDFEEAERKLELPKISGFKLPKLFSAPKIGFLDRIKRFLFFTALGWLFPKIIDFLPKLKGIVDIIVGVSSFATDLFGKLLDGFSTFVKFGKDLNDKTIGFLKNVGGEDYANKFIKLEDLFNKFTDAAIIAGLLAVDIGSAAIDEYNKWRKKAGKPSEPRKPSGVAEAKRAGKVAVTEGRGGQKGLGKAVEITEGVGGKKPSLWKRFTSMFKLPPWMEKLTSKLKGGPFKKLAGPFKKFLGAAVPFAGAAIGEMDARQRFASGDNVGGWLARTSAILDGFAGGAAVAGLGFASTVIGAAVTPFLEAAAGVATGVSMFIDALLLVRDILNAFGIKAFAKGGRIVNKYQKGGTTRGGKPIGAPKRRTYTPVKKKPFKANPQRTQPGKNVGGEGKVKLLYPDLDPKKPLTILEWINAGMPGNGQYRDYVNQFNETNKDAYDKPNPYNALTSTSKILKDISTSTGRIPGIPNSKDAVGYLMNGIGGLMGASVDAALGQKIDPKMYRSFSSGIGYLIDVIVNQRVGSIGSTLGGFADGGYVPPSREIKQSYESLSSGDLISKIIGPSIEQRINEAIQSIQKEIKKYKEEKLKPEEQKSGEITSADDYEYQVSGGELPSKYVGRFDYGEQRPGHIHAGEDYSINQGTAITVIIPGKVEKVESNNPAAGGYVLITHDNGTQTRYLHLSKILVKERQEVSSGNLIGLTGGEPGTYGAGRSTGPHLHFEYYPSASSSSENPRPYADKYFRFGKVTRIVKQKPEVSYDSFQGTGKVFTGSASWYGRQDGFQGKPTSNGEIFDTNKLTAAIQINLRNEFGGVSAGKPIFYAKVTNIENNKFVIVRVNDVGPLVPGGVIDLSEAAFKRIASGGLGQGRIPRVTVEKLSGAPRIVTPGRLPPQINQPSPTSSYGVINPTPRTNIKTNPGGYAADTGLDIMGSIGDPIISPVNGILEYAEPGHTIQSNQDSDPTRPGFQPQHSFRIKIDNPFVYNGKNVNFVYGTHLSSISPSVLGKSGIKIRKGQLLGKMGQAGNPPVPHLHIGFVMDRNQSTYLNYMEVKDLLSKGSHASRMKSGGLISPSKPNRSIPNSFASYETYGSGMILAIQPIIIEKQIPSQSQKMISFPVAIEVNSSIRDLSSVRG